MPKTVAENYIGAPWVVAARTVYQDKDYPECDAANSYDVADALAAFAHNFAVAGAMAEIRQRAYREGYAHGRDYYE